MTVTGGAVTVLAGNATGDVPASEAELTAAPAPPAGRTTEATVEAGVGGDAVAEGSSVAVGVVVGVAEGSGVSVGAGVRLTRAMAGGGRVSAGVSG